MKLIEYERIIESILFVAGEPISLEKISNTLNLDNKTTKKILNDLIYNYETHKRGIIIIEIENSYQMCTNPIYFEYIKNIYKTPQRKILSQTIMETLAIICYKQPITKLQIEEIRGVSSEHSVNKLVEFNLVCEKGRSELPGKPILFGTTDEFLKYFGFNNLSQLPELLEASEALKIEAFNEVEKLGAFK